MKLLPWFLPFGSIHRGVLNSEAQPAVRQLSVPLADKMPSASAFVRAVGTGFALQRIRPFGKGS